MPSFRNLQSLSLFCSSAESGLARWARWTVTGPQKRLPAAAKSPSRTKELVRQTHYAWCACQFEVRSWWRGQDVAVTQLVAKEEDQEQEIRGWRWDWEKFDTWWYRWEEGKGKGERRSYLHAVLKTSRFPNRALPFCACSRDSLERKSSDWEWRWVIDRFPTFLSHLPLQLCGWTVHRFSLAKVFSFPFTDLLEAASVQQHGAQQFVGGILQSKINRCSLLFPSLLFFSFIYRQPQWITRLFPWKRSWIRGSSKWAIPYSTFPVAIRRSIFNKITSYLSRTRRNFSMFTSEVMLLWAAQSNLTVHRERGGDITELITVCIS